MLTRQKGKIYLMSSIKYWVRPLLNRYFRSNPMKSICTAMGLVVALSTFPSAEPGTAPGPVAQNREWREVTIPAGTILKVNLNTAVGSDTSRVEDPVRGTLRVPVTIGGVQALPAGTALSGHVTDAARSARVKGRARIAFRFTRIDPPGPDDSMTIRTGTVARVAPGTKKKDAATIGAGAVGGAIVGGIVGGGDGAAKGAAIGGAGGTGVVLATRGKEVRMAAGTPLGIRLSQALVVRVPMR
jgi:hypothetical protein